MKLQLFLESPIAAAAPCGAEDPRDPFVHGAHLFVGLEDAVDDAGGAYPLVGLAAQLACPGRGEGIEARAAIVVGGADARLDPAALLEPQQRRVDGALIEREQETCWIRWAMPYPCSGPSVSSVLSTSRSSVPRRISDLSLLNGVLFIFNMNVM
jgi:hypothetical protein